MVAYKAAVTPEDSRTTLVRVNPHQGPGAATLVVTSQQVTVRAKRFSNALNVATKLTPIRNAARNILRLGEIKHLHSEVRLRSDRERTRQPRAQTHAASTPKAA